MEQEFDLESLCVLKLINGEVIVCEIIKEDQQELVVRYAIRAVEMVDGAGEGETLFLPWIPYTDELIILYRQGILAAAPPNEEMRKLYLNRMAELETEEVQSNDEPPMIQTCSHGKFNHKK